MNENTSVHLPDETAKILRKLVERIGVDRTAKLLSVTRTVLTSALAGLAVRRATAEHLRGAVEALRAVPEKRAEMVHAEVLHRPVEMFLAQCCELAPDASIGALLLFQAWERWCEPRGVASRTARVFEQRLALAAPGVTAVRASPSTKRAAAYTGIGLKP